MKYIVLLALLSLLAFAAPAEAAYTHQSTCRSALQGYPPGTDNEFKTALTAINNNTHWPTLPANSYQWGFFNRYSDNYMRQDFLVYRSDGVFQVIAYCNDSNATDAISSAEDYWTVIAKQ